MPDARTANPLRNKKHRPDIVEVRFEDQADLRRIRLTVLGDRSGCPSTQNDGHGKCYCRD